MSSTPSPEPLSLELRDAMARWAAVASNRELLSAFAPGVPAPRETGHPEIQQAEHQFTAFTSNAQAIERDLNAGQSPSSEEVAARLDEAHAWVAYFSPDGALVQSLPIEMALPERIDCLTHIAKMRRIAEDWAGYLDALRRKTASSRGETDAHEQASLGQLRDAAQRLNERLMYFTLSSGNVDSGTIQGYINELYGFLATFQAWRSTANQLLAEGRPAYSEELEALISRVTTNIETFQFTYRSRVSFEGFQRQQGIPAGGASVPSTGRPGPGTPEWFSAVTGSSCYWCGQDLTGLPQPIAICPRCGRFPAPPGP